MPDNDKRPVIPVARAARSIAKRAFDVLLSSLMLLISSPAWVAIMTLILW